MRISNKRIIAIILLLVMLTNNMYGCSKQAIEPAASDTVVPTIADEVDVDKEKLVDDIVADITSETNVDEKTVEEVLTVSENFLISDNWEDYIGDFETFVYGLLINDLRYGYEVFPAYVELESGDTVSGIAYTDFSECYSNDDETEKCIMAGLIPYCGELEIPDDDFDEGLEIINLDYPMEDTSFMLKYKSDEYIDHCVVYDKYLKYGIDNEGKVFYEESEYNENTFDKSIGSLFSYDTGKYVYDLDFGQDITVTGTSLSSSIDYDELEKEINKVLDEQDKNFATVDVDTYVYMAQEAVEAYFLSMQEETFLGYDVKYLAEIAKDLDPMECYRITSDGLMVIEIDDIEDEVEKATALTKWIIGSLCVVEIISGMVGSMVTIECPPLSAYNSAIVGVAIDVFMQVVIESKTLKNVDWGHVAFSAVTGAVSGFLGPYVMATFSGASYFVVDSALDGVMGAIEHASIAWINGESGKKILEQMGYGFALGFCLSAGFKVAGDLVGKAVTKASNKVAKLNEKMFPKMSKKVAAVLKDKGDKISEAIYTLKKAADNSRFHSTYISNKLAWRQVERLIENADDVLVKKSIDSLKANDILDEADNIIDKKALKEIFKKAKNGEIIAHFKVDGEVVQVIKQNGAAGVLFDKAKYQTVTLKNALNNDRNENFALAAEELKKSWKKDPSLIPDSLAEQIKIKYSIDEIDAISNSSLISIIKDSDYVLHENIDLKTITLVSRTVHDKAIGGVSHMGGFALRDYMKEHMGAEFFDRFLGAASTAFSSAY